MEYEVIPNTINAFYRVTHSDTLAFDVLMDQVPTIGNVYERCLAEYRWEIGMLYPESRLEKKEIQLLQRFVGEEYRKICLRKEE